MCVRPFLVERKINISSYLFSIPYVFHILFPYFPLLCFDCALRLSLIVFKLAERFIFECFKLKFILNEKYKIIYSLATIKTFSVEYLWEKNNSAVLVGFFRNGGRGKNVTK